MENNKLFVIASRMKYRYPYKGLISTEDLWDLSLQDLDSIFKTLNSQLKALGEESLLVEAEDNGRGILMNKIEIIKYILRTKLETKARNEQAAINAAKRKRIMEVIASKEDAALRDMSVEDLNKMLNDLM